MISSRVDGAVFAIVPVKPLDEGKSRLDAVLPAPERRAFNRMLLDRTLAAVAAFPGPGRTIVVSRSKEVLELAAGRGFHPLPEACGEACGGLNDALAQATRHALALGADGLFVLPVDLPLVDGELIRRHVAHLGSGVCAIAPDRKGQGTNFLYVSPPQPAFYRFGPASLEEHAVRALVFGLKLNVIEDERLAFDIDDPDDYRLWRQREAQASPD